MNFKTDISLSKVSPYFQIIYSIEIIACIFPRGKAKKKKTKQKNQISYDRHKKKQMLI